MKNLSVLLLMLISIPLFSKQIEEMHYNLKFGFIKAGEARILISDTIFNDHPAVHYLMELKTTGLSNSLLGIHDIYESIVNPDNMLPYKSIRNIKEASYRYYNEVLYFHDGDTIQSLLSGTRDVPENLIDILSVFLYFRKDGFFENISEGENITMPTLDSDKISDVTLNYLGMENIRTKKGKIDCYVLSPHIKAGKVLESSDGIKFNIIPENLIPVELEFEVKIGALKGVLKSYTLNGQEMWN